MQNPELTGNLAAPGRFPLGYKHDGWLSDGRVCGSNDGGVVLHGGPRVHVGLDCTFCSWHVLTGQMWFRSVKALAGQVLPRAECSLRCCSTFLLMGLHGRCLLRAREFR